MKTLLTISLFLCVFASISPAAVIVDMLVDNMPIDYILTPPGSFVTIDFNIAFDDLFPEFYGIIALEGVGTLNEPTYPGIIVPLDPPQILPANQWPLYFIPFPQVTPPQGVFASSVYEATEFGNAAINLYQTDAAFSSLTLIDSLTINVGILPEPSTLLILCTGIGVCRLRKNRLL